MSSSLSSTDDLPLTLTINYSLEQSGLLKKFSVIDNKLKQLSEITTLHQNTLPSMSSKISSLQSRIEQFSMFKNKSNKLRQSETHNQTIMPIEKNSNKPNGTQEPEFVDMETLVLNRIEELEKAVTLLKNSKPTNNIVFKGKLNPKKPTDNDSNQNDEEDLSTKGAGSRRNLQGGSKLKKNQQNITSSSKLISEHDGNAKKNSLIGSGNSNLEKQFIILRKRLDTMEEYIKELTSNNDTKMRELMEAQYKRLESSINEVSKSNSIIADYTADNTQKIEDINAYIEKLKANLENTMTNIDQDSAARAEHARVMNETLSNNVAANIDRIREDYQALISRFESLEKQQIELEEQVYESSNGPDGQNSQSGGGSLGGRDSVLGGTRNSFNKSEALKMNSKVEVLQHHVKSIINELKGMKDETKKKDLKRDTSRGSFLPQLPTTGSSTNLKDTPALISSRSNSNSIEQQIHWASSEIKKLYDRIHASEEAVENFKGKVKKLEETYSQLPIKIYDLEKKQQEQAQIREQRLLELIKQLINRCLTDPFNNQFTSTLKREIHVKFLEIKHEYYGILKQIEKKVEDRADRKQLQHFSEKVGCEMNEIRAILNKKGDVEDMRKSNKFIEGKLRDLYTILKINEAALQEAARDSSLTVSKRKA